MNIERLKALREVGRTLLRERKGDIGFGKWDCGTFACFAGHYCRTGRYDVQRLNHNLLAFYDLADHFEISESDAERLFLFTEGTGDIPGPEAYAELERRLAYLDELIGETKRPGIPDSVLSLFKEVA